MSFQQVADEIHKLGEQKKLNIPDKDLLILYGLYKQGKEGNVHTARPTGMLDFKGKAKWDAWKANEGMSKQEAQKKYA